MSGTVQELRSYCLQVIAQNISENSQLGLLTEHDLSEVCAALSVDLPLSVALALPLNDLYWRRRTQAHFPPPHISLQGRLQQGRKGGKDGGERGGTPPQGHGEAGGSGGKKASAPPPQHPSIAPLSRPLPPVTVVGSGAGGGRWRQLYLESHLSRVICGTQDNRRGWRQLTPLLQVCGGLVHTLHLPSLAPPTTRGSEETRVEQASFNHLDLSEVIAALPNLKELSVRYQTTQEGWGLVWGGLGASLAELGALTTSLAATTTLTHLRIYESCIDDARAEVLLTGLRGHPGLMSLDLRHNFMTSSSAPHLVNLVTSCALTSLNLQHNNIGSEGGCVLGIALARTPPPPLEALLLDLNPLGSEGGAALLKGAAAGGHLKVLSLAGCRLGDRCWEPLAGALGSSLRYVCLAANPFTQDPPEDVIAASSNAGQEGGPRVLLTNLQGTTYLLGQVKGGRCLAPPLAHLQERLLAPLTPTAAREDLAHYLPLHGTHLAARDFTLEEELRGMCLFTKNATHIL